MEHLLDSKLKIYQTKEKLTAKAFDAFHHVLIIIPKRSDDSVLSKLPQGIKLKKLLKFTGKTATSRLNNANFTGLTLAISEQKTTFELLTWARKTLENIIGEKSSSLGIVILDIDEDQTKSIAEALVAAAEAMIFKTPQYKSKENKNRRLSRIKFFQMPSKLNLSAIKSQALGNNIARWFTIQPPNKLDAKIYCSEIKKLVKPFNIKYKFYDEKILDQMGAGAFLAVSQGNKDRNAGIIKLSYRPNKNNEPDLALVGKGIIFDTGGTNLKPFQSMLNMHMDMEGSAVALGTIIALAHLKVPFSVDAWLAITENRISSTAYKSQDIIKAYNGTTIQTIHTDAEGRMVLADTLSIASKEKPKMIIDYATLTGSCVAALSQSYSGVFSNRNNANNLMLEAGIKSGERVWPFPMDDDLEEPIKSDIADIKQCAISEYGDHIHAAKFLSHFVPKNIPWVHIDLSSGKNKGGLAHIPTDATGFGVKLTVELFHSRKFNSILKDL
jgi:leucyl aminopeptidase|tara:strand:+ start:514 stop:2007 length:1494 start_codon:yes stop_codon:yes gene_type:complete